MKKFTLSIIALLCSVMAMNAELYMVGDQTGWNRQAMTESPANVYTWTGDFKADNTFKFLTGNDWAPCWTCDWVQGGTQVLEMVESGVTYKLTYKPVNEEPDSKFKMAVTGNYTVVVDLDKETMVCTLNSTVVPPDLFIVGGGTPVAWTEKPGNSWKMNRTDLTYTEPIFLTNKKDDSRFVFLTEKGWYPRFISNNGENARFYDVETATDYELTKCENGMGSAGFVVKETGVYNVNVTLNEDVNGGVMTLSHANLTIVGPAIGGWDLGKSNNYNLKRLANGNYTWTGDLNAGEFRINYKGEWWPCFVGQENFTVPAEGGAFTLKWTAPEATSPSFAADGKYTLEINFEGEDPVLMVTRIGNYGEELPLTELYICGNALNGREGGWNLDENYVKAMEPTPNEGEFTWTGYLYPGQFKFLCQSNEWAPGLVATEQNKTISSGETYPIVTSVGNPDNKFVIPEEDQYIVNAKTFGENKSMSISKFVTGIENILNEAAVLTVSGRTISANGALAVYDTMGRKVGAVNGGSIALPAAGVYIAVSGNKAMKVAVK